ncbi:protein LTO1 homolog isoform X3 [Pteropus medius]|uniref:protein LTO1 homolog isoform X3 n=1 Tax=Pteropus vampyrus TaxID=132908 RepID=UPI00196B8FFE|nr:protein LTO1 homolog isoform X3 [Pteropus giganteus]
MAGGQDLFDAIVMADDRFHGQGYQEGYEEGSSLGIIEGRQHGTLHGAKIGSEVGCYQGFAFAWRGLLRSHATGKDRSVWLNSLEKMIKTHLSRSPRHRCRTLEKSQGAPREASCSHVAMFTLAGSYTDAESLTPLTRCHVAAAGLPPAFREQIVITSPWHQAVSKIAISNG